MKGKHSLWLAALGLTATAVLWAVVLLDSRLPAGVCRLLAGLGGALGGISGTTMILHCLSRRCTAQQRKELERGERDERNVAIRERAAQSSWYWSLYLLWALFIAALVLGPPVYIALTSGVIVLHCVFYLINMGRWAKRM